MPTRIFTRRRSLASRILGASALALSLVVTLAGLGTVTYLERARDAAIATPLSEPSIAFAAPADSPTAPASAIEPAPSVTPEAATPAQRMPAGIEAPRSEAMPPETPAAGSSAPVGLGAPLAALEPPPLDPAVPSLGDAGRYWVEYGVFVGEGYARRLQQALADNGLASLIVETHAPDGRALRRVRSVALADHAEAREVAARAERALGIAPLVHRSAGEPPRAPAPQTVTLTSAAPSEQRYWVQFGAFARTEQAQHLQDALRESGVDTAVSTSRAASGRLLFLVRSVLLPDRDSALALAHRGQHAAKVDVLVGRSLEPHHATRALPSRLASGEEGLTTETVRQ